MKINKSEESKKFIEQLFYLYAQTGILKMEISFNDWMRKLGYCYRVDGLYFYDYGEMWNYMLTASKNKEFEIVKL